MINKLIHEISPYKYLIFCLVIFFLYLFDLGNINAIRQGTEGFYLQIAKEMFQEKSFLTPLYLGNPHWSKPPLHFWLTWPFNYIFGDDYIFAARLSVLTTSLLLVTLMSYLLKRYLNVSFSLSFFSFLSILGFLKYSRIYMMEMPLAFLGSCGALFFYLYLKSEQERSLLKNNLFFLAVIFSSAAILIKGPVSYVTFSASFFVYQIIHYLIHKKVFLIKYFLLSIFTFFLSSVWFVLCYLEYGQGFIEYFFLRENMGKFTAKSYPVRSVVQGLFIYSFPVIFFLKTDIKKLISRIKKNDFLLFTSACFLVTLIIWMIPSQRSHHYAMPAIPYLVMFTSFYLGKYKLKSNLAFYLISALLILITSILIFALNFEDITSNNNNVFRILSAIIIFIMTIIVNFTKKFTIQTKLASFCISTIFLWNIVAGVFYLEIFPEHAQQHIGRKKVAVVVRKPFYFSQQLQREVAVLDTHTIKPHINSNNKRKWLYIVHEDLFQAEQLNESANVLHTWTIWKRGRKASHILEALRSRKLSLLQENLVLLRPKL